MSGPVGFRMGLTGTSLPEYESPPLIEVVFGIQFRKLDKLLAPHVGLLWEKFREEYSTCRELPPIAPVVERFGGKGETEVEISEVPPLPRIWFERPDGTGIIQVQRDRFLHNWKTTGPGDEYPRYHSVSKRFLQYMEKFKNFVEESGLGVLNLTQYDLTYVNHILKGEGWEDLADLGSIFPDFSWGKRKDRFLPVFSDVNWQSTVDLPEKSGRLRIGIRSGNRQEDGFPLVRFELAARGVGSDKSEEGMRDWFDTAHEWIVRGFTDLTSEEIQEKIWRRTQ